MAQFLQKDLDALAKKIKITTERLREAMIDGAESAQQSSETWHDNFGFEEASRQQKMLGKQIEEMRKLFESAEVVSPQKGSDTVVVGSRIKLVNVETGEEKAFFVGSYMVLDKTEDSEVSYSAPIIAPFFGTHIGELREVSIAGKISEYELIEIA